MVESRASNNVIKDPLAVAAGARLSARGRCQRRRGGPGLSPGSTSSIIPGSPITNSTSTVFFREFQDNTFTNDNWAPVLRRPDRPYGGRPVFKGKGAGFDYSLEVMSQTGHQADDRINSYAYVATLGYTFDMDWKPRIRRGVRITPAATAPRRRGNERTRSILLIPVQPTTTRASPTSSASGT